MSLPGPLGLDDADDGLLVDRAVDGDVRAFEVIVRRYSRILATYAARILGSTAHADDVVQDTFVTAWDQLDRLTDRGALKGWLLRIAARNALQRRASEQRRREVHEEAAAPDGGQHPEAMAVVTSQAAALTRALASLPEQQRQAWLLREAGGLSYAEVAAELVLPVSTVRGLLVRARERLAREMAAWR